ncbi:hypothetical protein WJX75_006601 [Coccomyxa subellipsoidea]|uniref:Uncharacterized protein n=1 Tax=Coccomyxa subellipsoidea TaxID=248742 RepID=A0ABR2YQ60_9CHLO
MRHHRSVWRLDRPRAPPASGNSRFVVAWRWTAASPSEAGPEHIRPAVQWTPVDTSCARCGEAAAGQRRAGSAAAGATIETADALTSAAAAGAADVHQPHDLERHGCCSNSVRLLISSSNRDIRLDRASDTTQLQHVSSSSSSLRHSGAASPCPSQALPATACQNRRHISGRTCESI